MMKWVARLKCGHDMGGYSEAPELGSYHWCLVHNDLYAAVDVVTNEPERKPNGRTF